MYERFSLAFARILTLDPRELTREDGQGAVEYALAVLAVAAIIAAAMAGFTDQITAFMAKAGAKLLTYAP